MKNEKQYILCVDDDPDDLFLIRDSITRITEIAIETASNGKQALDFILQGQQAKNLPSLIVLDLNMPIMDGHKLIRAIKEDDKLNEIPIVVFTTSAKPANLDYVKTQKIEIITKPTDWDSYQAIAKKLVAYLSNAMSEALPYRQTQND